MKRICFVFRKKNPLFFSIEKVFDTIFNETAKAGWKTIRVGAPYFSSGLKSVMRNILSLRKGEKADLYHISGDIHYAVFAYPAKKTILTIHDCGLIGTAKGLRKWVLLRLFLKWPVSYANAVTTISEQSKNEIIRLTGCPADKIKVIPNPVSEAISESVKPFNSARPKILFIGSTPNKNLSRTIEALAGLDCHLEIIGKISREYADEIEKCGVSFTVVSDLTEGEVNQKYADCDLLVFPSLLEGFGLPIIEAQQAGRAVVTSNLAPMNEVAGNGACLVDPYSVASIRAGIEKVVADASYREKLIYQGKQNCARYRTNVISAQYLTLYDDLLIR